MTDAHDDRTWMRRALELARRGEGSTRPNPMVGAVVVRDGRVVGEGFHHAAGLPHAEVEALAAAGEAARGARLFVNLEPCAHHGRTPPCVDAILAAGVAEVIYAVRDPFARVDGRGHAALAAAGVAVTVGPGAAEARELNLPFLTHAATGRPWVVAKFAMSLDGKIATRTGSSRWISSPASRRRVHRLRQRLDAVLVGAGTALADDPRLTARLEDGAPARQPWRIVADSRGRVPATARLFASGAGGRAVLATTAAAPAAHREALAARGVEVWVLPADGAGRVRLEALLDELGRRQLQSLLVEGGGELLGSLIERRLVDRVLAVVAPLVIGGREAPGPVGGRGAGELAEALRLDGAVVETVGGDVWIRADPSGRPSGAGSEDAAAGENAAPAPVVGSGGR